MSRNRPPTLDDSLLGEPAVDSAEAKYSMPSFLEAGKAGIMDFGRRNRALTSIAAQATLLVIY